MKGLTHQAQFKRREVTAGESGWGDVFLTWACHLEPISPRVILTGSFITSTHRAIGPYATPAPEVGDMVTIAPNVPTGEDTEIFYVVGVHKRTGPRLPWTTMEIYLRREENP